MSNTSNMALRVNGIDFTLVYLQGCGHLAATKTADLRPGMTMVWNTGGKSVVVSIEVKGQTAHIVERTEDGRTWNRKRRLTTYTVTTQAVEAFREAQKAAR